MSLPSVRPPKWEIDRRWDPGYSRDREGTHIDFQLLLQQQHETLQQFRDFACRGDWGGIHSLHFDWWMFPVDDGSRPRFNLKSEADVASLKARNWTRRYREGMVLASQAWGWDLENAKLIPPPLGGRWTEWDVRLAKMIRSAWLMQDQLALKSLQKFALHIRRSRQDAGRDPRFFYGKICLDEIMAMHLPRRGFLGNFFLRSSSPRSRVGLKEPAGPRMSALMASLEQKLDLFIKNFNTFHSSPQPAGFRKNAESCERVQTAEKEIPSSDILSENCRQLPNIDLESGLIPTPPPPPSIQPSFSSVLVFFKSTLQRCLAPVMFCFFSCMNYWEYGREYSREGGGEREETDRVSRVGGQDKEEHQEYGVQKKERVKFEPSFFLIFSSEKDGAPEEVQKSQFILFLSLFFSSGGPFSSVKRIFFARNEEEREEAKKEVESMDNVERREGEMKRENVLIYVNPPQGKKFENVIEIEDNFSGKSLEIEAEKDEKKLQNMNQRLQHLYIILQEDNLKKIFFKNVENNEDLYLVREILAEAEKVISEKIRQDAEKRKEVEKQKSAEKKLEKMEEEVEAEEREKERKSYFFHSKGIEKRKKKNHEVMKKALMAIDLKKLVKKTKWKSRKSEENDEKVRITEEKEDEKLVKMEEGMLQKEDIIFVEDSRGEGLYGVPGLFPALIHPSRFPYFSLASAQPSPGFTQGKTTAFKPIPDLGLHLLPSWEGEKEGAEEENKETIGQSQVSPPVQEREPIRKELNVSPFSPSSIPTLSSPPRTPFPPPSFNPSNLEFWKKVFALWVEEGEIDLSFFTSLGSRKMKRGAGGEEKEEEERKRRRNS